MLDVKKITKTVMMEGEPVEVVMTEMMRPKTKEELAAMTPGEREHCKFQPALNTRVYVAEEGIVCMQDQPVAMRDGATIYADIYRPEGAADYFVELLREAAL